jgi:hypothetical protein
MQVGSVWLCKRDLRPIYRGITCRSRRLGTEQTPIKSRLEARRISAVVFVRLDKLFTSSQQQRQSLWDIITDEKGEQRGDVFSDCSRKARPMPRVSHRTSHVSFRKVVGKVGTTGSTL